MSVRVRLDASGIAEVYASVDYTLTELAEDIEADAKRYAPVDTGALREGIEATPAVGNKVRIRARRAFPGDDPDVPIFVEFGTENTPAQPFMRPALYQRRALRGRS